MEVYEVKIGVQRLRKRGYAEINNGGVQRLKMGCVEIKKGCAEIKDGVHRVKMGLPTQTQLLI